MDPTPAADTRSIAQLSMLHALANQLNRLRDVPAIGEAIARELHRLIDYNSCRVYIVEDDGVTLMPIALEGDEGYDEDEVDDLIMKIGEGLTGHVAESRESYYTPNALEDSFAEDIPGTDDVDESMMGVPLTYGEDLVGVVIITKLGVDQFDDRDLRVLEVLAPHAAVAMVNAAQVVELEQSRDRLRTLDDMKTMFLEAVSHDLRTPLASVLGISLTLSRGEVDLSSEDARDLLERLARNAQKLERLLEDLLDLDRLMRGIVEPNLRLVDVGALVTEVVHQEEALAGRTVVLDCDTVTIAVDPPKVERIVENLVVNAARYTPEGATVWVGVHAEDGGGVLINVDDEGPGVPKEEASSIFEAFRQGPQSSRHAPGVGIGLSLVSRFSELHGGQAWVEDRPGGGASFKVALPRSGRGDPELIPS